jgi:hypothetical protein
MNKKDLKKKILSKKNGKVEKNKKNELLKLALQEQELECKAEEEWENAWINWAKKIKGGEEKCLLR